MVNFFDYNFIRKFLCKFVNKIHLLIRIESDLKLLLVIDSHLKLLLVIESVKIKSKFNNYCVIYLI